MSTAECVVCDYTIELPELVLQQGLTEVKVPTLEYMAALALCDAALEAHLDTHSVVDFLNALQQADEYIADLEKALQDAENKIKTLQQVKAPGKSVPAVALPPEWSQGIQEMVQGWQEDTSPVEVSEDNPRGLRYPNGRPSLRAPGRSGL